MTTRPCYRGDTICTVKPINYGQDAGKLLYATCGTAESCAQANELIGKGSWKVFSCGKCSQVIENCKCLETNDGKEETTQVQEH